MKKNTTESIEDEEFAEDTDDVENIPRRSRKSRFPSPEFNFFSIAINAAALFFTGFLFFIDTSGFSEWSPFPATNLILTLVALFAVGVAVYASWMEPTAENKRERGLMTALGLGLGTLLLLGSGVPLAFL